MPIRYLSGVNVDSNTLVVDAVNNRVGINTASPDYALDLGTSGTGNQIRARRIYANGTGTDSGYTLDNTLIFQGASNSFNITNPGSYPSVAFTINSSGNVGIGTTSPATNLDVNGSINIASGNNLTWGGAYGAGIPTIAAAGGGIYFYPAGSTSGATMRITNTGDVGIGTTAPTQLLSVAGNTDLGNSIGNVQASTYTTRLSGFALYYDASNRYGNYGVLLLNADSGWTSSSRRFMITNGYSANKLAIIRSVDSTTDPALGYGGSVTSGTVDFEINNAGAATFGSSVTASSLIKSGGTSAQYLMADGSVSTLTNPVTGTGTTNYVPKFTSSSAIGNSQIFDNGTNVGIGTASPFSKLEVAGNIKLGNTLDNTQRFIGRGDANSEASSNGGSIGFISSTTEDHLTFNTHKSGVSQGERMRITSTGDLLVGTTSSTYSGAGRGLIVVNGSTNSLFGWSVGGASKGYMYHEGTNAYLENSVSGGFFNLTQVGAGYFSFNTNSAERMRITSGGNVGIGTTAPGQKLQIDSPLRTEFYGTDSSSPADAMNIVGTGASRALGTGSALLFSVPANTDGTNTWAQARILGTGDNATNGSAEGAMFLQTRALYNPGVGGSWNWRTNMVLRASGNVGIGTTSPAATLQVSKGGVVFQITDTNKTANNSLWIQALSQTSWGIGTADNSASGTKITLTDGGNVGIGATAPVSKLQVNHSAAPSFNANGGANALTLVRTGGSGAEGTFGAGLVFSQPYLTDDASIGVGGIYGVKNNGNGTFGGGLAFFAQPNSASNMFEVMRITSAGNVGIGTTTPDSALDLGAASQGRALTWESYSNVFSAYSSGNLVLAQNFYGDTATDTYKTSLTASYGAAGILISGTAAGLNGVMRFYVDNAAAKTAGAAFTPTERMQISGNGAIKFSTYGAGTFTGTAAYNLGVDSSGNVIELPGGVVDGSGTANYVSKWTDANTIANSAIYNSTNYVAINTTTGTTFALDVFSNNAAYNSRFYQPSTSTADYVSILVSGAMTSAVGYLGAGGSTAGNASFQDAVVIGTQSNHRLVFNTNDAERMRLTAGGNFLIGTTTDSGYKLDVSGTGRFTSLLQVNGPSGEARTDLQGINLYNANNDYRISFDSQSGTKGFIRYNVDTAASSSHGHIFSAGDYNGSVTDLMLVRADGNVGIGTTAPVSALSVVGKTNLGNQASGFYVTPSTLHIASSTVSQISFEDYVVTAAIAIANNTFAFGHQNASPSYEFKHSNTYNGNYATTGTTFARFNPTTSYISAGNVGIGTTIPGSKLQVTATSNSATTVDNGITILNDSGVNNCLAGIRLSTYGDSDGGLYPKQFIGAIRDGDFGAGKGSIVFCNRDAADTSVVALSDEKMRILPSGNVGIGTTSPASNLEIEDATLAELYIDRTSAKKTSIGAGADGSYLGYDSTGYLEFATVTGARAAGYSSKVRITSAGNVGIGTTSPSYRLHAVVASAANADIFQAAMAGVSNGFSVQRVSSSFVYSMLDGGLGINNAAPTQALHVSGNVRVTGAYYDSNNEAGTSGQVLTSTGTGTDWKSLSEITGVDGTGTANYVAKWSDTDTITNSSITDNGSTVTATVDRLNMNKQAGIYVFSKAVGTSTTSDFFSISNSHGAQAFRVTFVCSSSGYSVAKTYEVVHGYGISPVYNKIVDTGAYSGNDFDVVFADSNNSNGTKATVTNNSTTNSGNIVATVFLGGGAEIITVTAL
jgi:hypothetical protein